MIGPGSEHSSTMTARPVSKWPARSTASNGTAGTATPMERGEIGDLHLDAEARHRYLRASVAPLEPNLTFFFLGVIEDAPDLNKYTSQYELSV
ncbi:MAG: hypothetical protein EOR99_26585 [Mesorhizobium sp.]|nr:MAG: hypothetical protein EOR99_26585 [Mesorhizobium sp.]